MTLSISYDGTKEDLQDGINEYRQSKEYSIFNYVALKNIEKDIIPNFEKFNKYTLIIVGNIYLYNAKGTIIIPYFYYNNIIKEVNKPLHNFDYTKILLYLILFFIVMLVIIFIICYFIDFDIYTMLIKNFYCFT